jgi:cytochrome P450
MDQSSQICNRLYDLARSRNAENLMLDLNGILILLIQRLEEADQVLRLNAGNYPKNMKWFRQALGTSRFSEDGQAWEIRRDLTQPYFNSFDRQRAFELAVSYARKTLATMIARSAAGVETLDELALRQLTANVVIENFLDVKLEDTSVDLSLMAEFMELGSEYSFIPTGKTATLYRDRLLGLAEVRRKILSSLSIFRSGDIPETPMLAGIRAADRDPSTGVVLEHELLTFLAAGAETSAATIGWACHLLATHPRLQEELRAVVQDFWQSAQPDWERLNEIEPLAQLISEALRLYPPTPILSRIALERDRLGDREIEAGQVVMISLVGLSHDERLRKNPWDYDTSKGVGSRGAGEKIAFSFGPRICGGKQFALVELMAVLAVFLAHARFEPTSDEPVRFFWKSQMLREGGQRVRVLPV